MAHEFGFEHGVAAGDAAVQSGCHQLQGRMEDPRLNVGNRLAGLYLVPAAIQILSGDPKLDHKIA